MHCVGHMPESAPIPDHDRTAQYCSPKTLGQAGRVTSASFKPRPVDAGKVSVTWVECARTGNATADVELARLTLRSTVRNYQTEGRIALVRAGQIRSVSMPDNPVNVVGSPTGPNRCHALIIGLEDALALEALADIA